MPSNAQAALVLNAAAALLVSAAGLQEAGIKAYQVELLNAWDKHRPAIEAVDPSLTLQELRHVTGLVRRQQQQQLVDS